MANVNILFHKSNKRAIQWEKKIRTLLKKRFPENKIGGKPDFIIALGGDGTILEAARKYQKLNPVVLGLNLGNVGFLASVRDEKKFMKALVKFFQGKFNVVERMMIVAEVKRRGRIVYKTEALNEILVKNVMGTVELNAKVEGHPVQNIKGTGILVSTATGSTAYNLSAHGPIVMPGIKCFIITELLDHSLPSPSLVVKYDHVIKIRIDAFRKYGLVSLTKTGEKIDVIIAGDGESIFSLDEGDEVIIRNSPNLIRFAELEKHYFFKSLEEKFGFK